MTNGNGNKTATIVFGVITAIIVPSLFFLGTNVIANDNKNTVEHQDIKAEMIERDEKIVESLHRFDVRQEVLIKSVGRIEQKL